MHFMGIPVHVCITWSPFSYCEEKKKLQATFSVFENLIDLTFYFTYCSVCGEGGGEGRGGPLIQELQLYNLGSVFWRTLHQELVSIA